MLCSGVRGLRSPGAGALELRSERMDDARNVTALSRVTVRQEQPGVVGHERPVETKTQARAIRQLRVDDTRGLAQDWLSSACFELQH